MSYLKKKNHCTKKLILPFQMNETMTALFNILYLQILQND